MATARGVFELLDRASRPLRNMERQAMKTQAAFDRLGVTLDAVADDKTMRKYERFDRTLRGVANSENLVTGRTDRMSSSFRRSSRDTDGLWNRVRRLGATLIGLQKIIGLFKIPALVAGVGALVQIVGALAGGVIALIPQIADLGGVLAALPAAVFGMAGAMITFKLATNDLSKALGGNKKALASLTPEARKFVETLKLYSPVITQLRRAAQGGGMFAGFDYSIRRLQRGVPVALRLLRLYSKTIGDIARRATDRVTDRNFMSMFEEVGNQGASVLSRAADGALNLVTALLNLAVAARPFTNWLTDTLVGWTKWAQNAAEAANESGRFAQFLTRTRASLTIFGHILRDAWFWLGAIGKAARPLGDILWRSAERGTAAWRRYAESIGGQVSLTRQFLAMADTIQQTVGLVEDLGLAIFHMGSQPGTANLVRSLRQMVPVLERILNVITAALGPPLLEALTQVARLLESVTGATGPLVILLTMFSDVLRVVNDLIQRFPTLGKVITGALVVVGINLMIGRVMRLAGAWTGVAAAAGEAAAAEAVASGVGAGGGVAGGRGLMAALGALFARGGAARGAAGVERGLTALPKGVPSLMLPGAGVGEAAVAGSRLARFAPLGKYGMGAARGLGKFALPATAVLALYDALTAEREGNFGMQAAQTGSAVLSGATFGIIPKIKTGREQMADREKNLLYGYDHEVGGRDLYAPGGHVHIPGQDQHVRGVDEILRGAVANYGGKNPRDRGDVTGQIRVTRTAILRLKGVQSDAAISYRTQLQQQIVALRSVNRQLLTQENNTKRLRRAQAAKTSVNQAERFESAIGTRFNKVAKTEGVEGAMTDATKHVTDAMKALAPAGRMHLARAAVTWAKQAAQDNPKLTDEYKTLTKNVTTTFDDLNKKVVIVNGKILTNSRRDWGSIRRTLITESKLAKQGLESNFAAITALAVGQLQALGYTPSQATQLAAATTANPGTDPTTTGQGGTSGGGTSGVAPPSSKFFFGGTGKARGGRLHGYGLGDSLDVGGGNKAAPGELIVNRHTERRVNAMLGGRSTLGGLVAGEDRPHWAGFAKGGRYDTSALLSQYPGLGRYAGQFDIRQFGASPMGYHSESYQKGSGDGFNPKRNSIALFGQNSPADVAGEMVSHFLARGIDPRLTQAYGKFSRSLTPDQMGWMRNDYKGEGGAKAFGNFGTYERRAGIPALFRGKLFGQLDSGDVSYTKAQNGIFSSVNKVLGDKRSFAKGGRAGGGVPPELLAAVNAASARYGISVADLLGIWRIESGSSFPNVAVNSLGYGGLFGTTHWNTSAMDQANYAASILSRLIREKHGNTAAAFSAYSGGGYTGVSGGGGSTGSNATYSGGGGGMGGASQIGPLGSPLINARGPAAALAQRGSDLFSIGLGARINENLAAMGGGMAGGMAAGGGPGGVVSTSGLVPQVQAALAYARAHGWTGSVTSGYRSVAKQQYLWDNAAALHLVRGKSVAAPGSSSHNFGQAVDVTNYQQFGQIMSSAPPGSRLYNAIGSDDPVHYSVSGHTRGGRLPDFAGWKAAGMGPTKFRRPTLIGVGEKGEETVTVTPRGGGGGRTFPINVRIDKIEYRGDGDIQEIVEREIDQAIRAVASRIDGMPMEDERAMST